MKRRYTISGIDHMIRLLNQHPQLLSLSSLVPITQVAKKVKDTVARTGCNCNAGPIYAANRGIFERALTTMQYGDHLIVKNVLNVDELCYYVKSDKGLVLKCI